MTVVNASLALLRKRFANAKRRTLYWSGNPSAGGSGFKAKPCHDGSMQYAVALSDQRAIAASIKAITGEEPAVIDYQRRFRDELLKQGS